MESKEVEKNTVQPKSKKGIIACIAALLIILGTTIIVFALCCQKSTNALDEAINNFRSAKNIAFDATDQLEFKSPEFSGAKSATISISASSLSLPTDISAKIQFITPENDEIFTDLKLKLDKNGKIFINIANLENFLDDMHFSSLLGNILGEDFYRYSLAEIDEEWWELDDDSYKTILSVLGKEDILAQDSVSACLGQKGNNFNHQNIDFLSVTPAKNNNRVNIDSDKLSDFLFGPLSCFVKIDKTAFSDDVTAFVGELPKFYIEIDQAHYFSSIHASNDTQDYTSNLEIQLHYNDQHPDFSQPESYLPLSDLTKLYKPPLEN